MPDTMNFQAERSSETTLLLRLGKTINTTTNDQVHALSNALRQARLDGIDDILPAYASVLLCFDPQCWTDETHSDPHKTLLAEVEKIVRMLGKQDAVSEGQGTLHKLPVCYGGKYGEDIDWVAEHAGLSPQDVIDRHSKIEYRVAMLGFAPGFAYLLGLDLALEVPRRVQPRTRVPAGSVAIGGIQTGIYPRQLPGGWQLIGRTFERLFDIANSSRPSLLQPGDRVRFQPINEVQFQDHKKPDD